ncbi:MAG TPA: hypothetical protein PKN48_00395 [Bacteroidales bacterium]|nr:hypothetical protein [Bacteroidales bacterium]
MNSIISATLDVVDYIINDKLEKLASTVESLSEDAKKAYIPSMEETIDMPERDFGVVLWHPTLGTFNKFAMNEPGITEININLLASNMAVMPDEVVKVASANLTCAAKKFGINIPESLEKTASKKFVKNIVDIREIDEAAFVTKIAKYEQQIFALPSEKKYPINNKEEIIKAAEYFDRNNNIFSLETKKEYIENLLKVGEQRKISFDKYPSIEKYAILRPDVFNDEFQYHITSRVSFLKESQLDFKELYLDLLKRSKEIGTEKTAAVLAVLDNKSGIAVNYGRGLEDPMISTFGIKKEAGVTFDGNVVTLGKLKSIPNADLTAVIGNSAIKELKGKDGLAVFNSLPKPVKQEVLSLIK